MTKLIFFGNGPLAETSLSLFQQSPHFQIVFHAKAKADLAEVQRLKSADPDLFGILASFGVLIKQDLLNLFEPQGILNIHPSLLPAYRGASPIETAILNGDQNFSVSIMKLVKAMDAGPLYFQTTLTPSDFKTPFPEKSEIYHKLSSIATKWLINHLPQLPVPTPQDDDQATFTSKFDTSMSLLDPQKPALALLNQIRAFQGFPKSKLVIGQQECIILKAHLDTNSDPDQRAKIKVLCGDNHYLIIDQLQPNGRKPMDAKSFYNGYMKQSTIPQM